MTILPLHITAGVLALVFGYTALFARKGATVHRKSGLFFVAAMVVMSLSGALMAAVKPSGSVVNVVAGLLTFYFVTTALLTVRAWGHTSLFLSHCVDRISVEYLTSGATPEAGTICRQDAVPFRPAPEATAAARDRRARVVRSLVPPSILRRAGPS